MSDLPTPGHGQNDLGYEQPPAATGPAAQGREWFVYRHCDGLPWYCWQITSNASDVSVNRALAPLADDEHLAEVLREHGYEVVRVTASEPKCAAPEGVAPNQDPVDWRARSQGLEDALRELDKAYAAYTLAALKGWPSVSSTRSHLLVVRAEAYELISLGLPDEEGEGRPMGLNAVHLRALEIAVEAAKDGAAPPPRGPSAQGADVTIRRDERLRIAQRMDVLALTTPTGASWRRLFMDLRRELGNSSALKATGPEPEPKAEAISKAVQQPVRDVTGEGER